MNNYIIPDLYCPFPSQVNQHVDVLEEYALEWALRFNLLKNELIYQRLSKSKFFLLAAGAYPYSQIEELKIANDLLNWVFIWDDQCDLSDLGKQPEVLKVFHQRFLEILNGSELTKKDTPLSYALGDLRQRMLQKVSKEWFLHLVHGFEEWFCGYEQEANIRAQGIIPDVYTYMKLRRASVGVNIFLTLTEMCHQLVIKDFLRNHNIMEKLKLMTGHIIAWSNDIFSASREMASGDVHNLVIVLNYQQQISWQQAIDNVAKMHDKEVKKMIRLEASIPSFGEEVDTQISNYILGCHTWIRSNLDWYSHSKRYQNTESLELVA
ncbi:Terpene synthase metal-binding domain-containing protein [Calothrix sp. PCC 7507]|uniref:terpene synthase family protein n=1 Tax=Calothrix sp. PCC 7507 TaxID=99598 RepID=UPI00029F4D5F|nr:Terpene synthase metal-binding domain-containing protein [Calothrix sp. PCC 7507]AFY35094.1 Terpene synthase metal-binding domain-containing protein [Calothrix sp. PCC 7507]